jgi:hypothetical protein
MKKHLLPLLIISAVAVIISNCSTPDTWEMSQWYTQLSRYKDNEVKAYAIHIKTLDEDKIQKICDYYQNKYGDSTHYLYIHFYDDRSFVPDYTNGVNFTEAQAAHMVARYYYNPFENDKRLEILQ